MHGKIQTPDRWEQQKKNNNKQPFTHEFVPSSGLPFLGAEQTLAERPIHSGDSNCHSLFASLHCELLCAFYIFCVCVLRYNSLLMCPSNRVLRRKPFENAFPFSSVNNSYVLDFQTHDIVCCHLKRFLGEYKKKTYNKHNHNIGSSYCECLFSSSIYRRLISSNVDSQCICQLCNIPCHVIRIFWCVERWHSEWLIGLCCLCW